jgi:hypothetical protein
MASGPLDGLFAAHRLDPAGVPKSSRNHKPASLPNKQARDSGLLSRSQRGSSMTRSGSLFQAAIV